jgi:hypothetical protein
LTFEFVELVVVLELLVPVPLVEPLVPVVVELFVEPLVVEERGTCTDFTMMVAMPGP